MATYMLRASLTPETFKGFLANPENRSGPVRKLIEAHGGKLLHYYFAFGQYDVLVIAEFPGNVDASAMMMTVASSGAFSAGETTVLLTIEEAVAAMKQAGSKIGTYRAPGGKAAPAPKAAARGKRR